ncbi:hypothetical protein Bca52824_067162 [Brassica carinata]|uniref:EF-hand domain-containing protein n=1 Tax=Brassica carinata TaxID=52824 RepID=A0A8X7QN76_BRACI|nr:hypothetical protein Bca52824_067162 [Brassica carinata]
MYSQLDMRFPMQIETDKAEIVTKEKNRASAVAMNAEIHRTKARLSEEVPKLQRLSLKRVKGLTTEELAARNDLLLALPARIEAIPDGIAGGPKSTTSAWAPSTTSRPDIKFDSDGRFDDDYFQESHESSQFSMNLRCAKFNRQVVSHFLQFLFRPRSGHDLRKGLDALKNMASDMNEELDRQVPLMDMDASNDGKVERHELFEEQELKANQSVQATAHALKDGDGVDMEVDHVNDCRHFDDVAVIAVVRASSIYRSRFVK